MSTPITTTALAGDRLLAIPPDKIQKSLLMDLMLKAQKSLDWLTNSPQLIDYKEFISMMKDNSEYSG